MSPEQLKALCEETKLDKIIFHGGQIEIWTLGGIALKRDVTERLFYLLDCSEDELLLHINDTVLLPVIKYRLKKLCHP